MRETVLKALHVLGTTLGICLRVLPFWLRKPCLRALALWSQSHGPWGSAGFRVAEGAYRNAVARPLKMMRRFSPGFSLQLDVSQKTQRQLYLLNVYEPLITNFFLGHLKEGDVCVDIGAHVGYFSMLAASKVGSTGRVLSLEPASDNFVRLSQHVKENGFENIIVPHQMAASDASGSMKLHRNPLNEGGHSLMEFETFADSEKRFSREEVEARYRSFAFSEEVSVVSCDALLEQESITTPSLIKIDTEGNELKVLKGAQKTLGQERLAVVCEVSHDIEEVLGLVRSLGFEVFYLGPRGWQKNMEAKKGNFLFLKGWDRMPI